MAVWLCLHLPRLGLEALAGEAEYPSAVTDRLGAREIVVCVNDAARSEGIQPGMAATQARTLLPDLGLRPRQLKREQATLRRLAAWALQYTSHVHLPPPPPEPGTGRLLLEIGGSQRLFGGQGKLIERIVSALEVLSYTVQSGHAAQPQAALLLARSGLSNKVTNLPTALLELPTTTLESLHASGLRRIGQVLEMPRASLGRRFGANCLDYLARLTGDKHEPLPAFEPPRRYKARLELAAEVEHIEALRFPLKRLVGELAGGLRGADAAVQQLALSLEHAQQPATVLRWSLSLPTRDAAQIQTLIGARLEQTRLAAPVRALRLSTARFVPYAARQPDLFESRSHDNEAVGALLDRLRARLGDDAVCYLRTVADHRPEHASELTREAGMAGEVAKTPRPIWLLGRPQPLPETPTLLAGPERLETGWWQADVARDYYIARVADGRRLWVFRERRAPYHWYVHGVFG